jgi:hypothetical protein
MSCLAFPPLLFYWMPDLTLAPVFPLVSCQAIFTRMPFLPDLQLALGGFWLYNQYKPTNWMADLTR